MNLTTSQPRVSVLLPVRDGLPYLREAITSVLGQDYTDLELVIVDDGSVDGSDLVARGFGDPRIRVIAGRGLGLAHALNLGLLAARGEYVARQDADDVSRRDRLSRLVAFLDATPGVDVAASRVDFIDEDGTPVESEWTRAVRDGWEHASTPEAVAELLPVTNCLVHGSVIARRGTWLVRGGYDESLAVAQDYDLWLRLLPDHCFARLPEALYAYRVHGGQISARTAAGQTSAAISAKLRYLRRVVSLPPSARVRILGSGRGVAHYRDALAGRDFVETDHTDDWDVAIATDFETLDETLAAAAALRASASLTRVGNFLVARTAWEAAA